MPNDKDDNNVEKKSDAIQRLERELYSRDNPTILRQTRHNLPKEKISAEQNWKRDKIKTPKKNFSQRFSPGFLKKLLISSLVFFIIAFSIAMIVIFIGFSSVSSRNIVINTYGPTSVDAGSESVLEISILNKNRVILEDASIIVEYPDGTRDPSDPRKTLLRQEEKIGLIPSKDESVRTAFKYSLYGQNQDVKDLKITVEYKTGGSNTIFTKSQDFKVGIKSAPVSLNISGPGEVSVGQEAEFRISVVSNSTNLINNLMLVVDYPLDFSFVTAEPQPVFDSRIWLLGDLNPRERREIILRGMISGREEDEKTFRFSAGLMNESDNRAIGIELASVAESLILTRPAFGLSLFIEGTESGDFITKIGNNLKGQLKWRNNLPVDLNEADFKIKLLGNPVDKISVSPDRSGFYQSQIDTIVWNKDTNPGLVSIKAGQSGVLDFSFRTTRFTAQNFELLRNGIIRLEAEASGTRISESRPSEIISSNISRQVKIETDISIAGRAVYSTGPFSNIGPLPPKAESQTTYTIIWSIANNLNDVEDVLVSATLPIYVEWLGQVSPAGAGLSYDSQSRIVKWNVNRLSAGTGHVSPPIEAAFRVGFVPSFSQVDTVPVILRESTVMATDSFVGTSVSGRSSPVTTRINTDPNYNPNMDRVVQ